MSFSWRGKVCGVVNRVSDFFLIMLQASYGTGEKSGILGLGVVVSYNTSVAINQCEPVYSLFFGRT